MYRDRKLLFEHLLLISHEEIYKTSKHSSYLIPVNWMEFNRRRPRTISKMTTGMIARIAAAIKALQSGAPWDGFCERKIPKATVMIRVSGQLPPTTKGQRYSFQ